MTSGETETKQNFVRNHCRAVERINRCSIEEKKTKKYLSRQYQKRLEKHMSVELKFVFPAGNELKKTCSSCLLENVRGTAGDQRCFLGVQKKMVG